ncbi:hypothetical protein NL676_014219 [Syzygium grande]|nr:hypothetical protein NL676_014219 [Syzygium grande]
MDLFSCARGSCYDIETYEQLVCSSMSKPFGKDDSYPLFLLRLSEGEDDEAEDVLASARVNEIEEEVDVEPSDGSHHSLIP